MEMIPSWLGPDVKDLMVNAGRLFADMGGYPLPKLPSQD